MFVAAAVTRIQSIAKPPLLASATGASRKAVTGLFVHAGLFRNSQKQVVKLVLFGIRTALADLDSVKVG